MLELGDVHEARVVFVELKKHTFPRHQLRPQFLQLFLFQYTGPVVLEMGSLRATTENGLMQRDPFIETGFSFVVKLVSLYDTIRYEMLF